MRKLTIAMASAATLALAACGGAPEEDTTVADDTAMADQMANDDVTAGTIVEVAQGNTDLSTLVSAVESANLGETLSGPGPYTVFAPTNAAFDQVPQETRDQLMSPEGQSDLSNILTYHVVAGEYMAGDLAGQALSVETVQGDTVDIDATGDNVMVDGATVIMADVDASNGVIHVINEVIMPE